MNKTLKKTLSIILTVLMIVTTLPMVFAAGDGVPLTIDVTDNANVIYIGDGYSYDDEDGYIITGTNKDLIIYVYEESSLVFSNATLKGLSLYGEAYDVTVTLEGDNYLGSIENYSSGILFSKQHLIIEGGEDDTLKINSKASAFSTQGGSGTLTVNGGKIIAVTETDKNYTTLDCFGGFVMNGGEVTLSNNYFDVVSCSVTLNGGELNIISTATDHEAINHKIAVGKGASFTASSECGILSDWDGTDIVMADDTAENESLFVKYNAEGEFVPVHDIKAALDGKTYAEIKVDAHEHDLDNNGKCACGYECPHEGLEDGECDVCGYFFHKITHQPTEAEPYVELNDDTDASYQWCGIESKEIEVTDEIANTVSYDWGESSYDKVTGWTGVPYEEDYYGQDFFTVVLKAGETVTVEVTGDIADGIGLYDYDTGEDVWVDYIEGVTFYELKAEAEGNYTFYAYVNSGVVTVKAYKEGVNYTEIEGETSAELKNPEFGKKYACEVTYGNGETEMSDVIDYAYAITHQPTEAEPYVELNDDTDASYQWYFVEGDRVEITDENALGDWQSIGLPFGNSVYEDGKWFADPSYGMQYYFMVDLEAGDTINFEFASDVEFIVFDLFSGLGREFAVGDTKYSITVEEAGTYVLITPPVDYLSAYIGSSTYTAVNGQTTDTLVPAALGKYACEVTFADGTKEMSDIVEFPYAITHQPTEAEPYVELNDDTDASYQWYKVEGGETEITDENAEAFDPEWFGYPDEAFMTTATYYDEIGWSPAFWPANIVLLGYFGIELKAGETVSLEFSSAPMVVAFMNLSAGEVHELIMYGTKASFTAEEDGFYFLMAQDTMEFFKELITVKAYFDGTTYTKIDGETAAAFTPTALGKYACEVTFADGTTEMSDTFEVTHICDFSGEWEYDGSKHWKECECTLTGEEENHSFTNGVCSVCEYECSHDNCTDSICNACGYVCTHEDGEAFDYEDNGDGKHTFTCYICEFSGTADHIFENYTTVVNADCENNAWESGMCVCDATDRREIPDSALGHNPSGWWQKNETEHWRHCVNDSCSEEIEGTRAEHSYTWKVTTEATATTDGEEEGTCECGYKTTRVIPATGETPEQPDTPDEPADDTCDHICHSNNALMKVLWKIISFFFRLFNIQQYCDCGVIHYDAPIFG